MLGVLDYEMGEVFCTEEEQYDAQVFLSFLETVVARHPKEKIVMVLNNARIHHAKLIQPFFTARADILQLLYLPPYSLQLNIIEELWGWLKRSVMYNVFYASVAEIRAAVQAFIHEINKTPAKTVDDCVFRCRAEMFKTTYISPNFRKNQKTPFSTERRYRGNVSINMDQFQLY